MHGSMVMYNFKVAGTIQFGVNVLDRGTIVSDIEDVRRALDMQDAVGELLGYFKSGYYSQATANEIRAGFNTKFYDESDEYAPFMITLRDQGIMSTYVDMAASMGVIVTMIFMFAMSLVLWNAGLLGGIRRYGEIGLRLAIGEEKRHVYWSMIGESVMIGVAGSILGTAIGLFFAWLIQTNGIEIGSMMEGSSVMMPSVIRAHITPVDFYIGFIPGVISTVIGTALAGFGIYKRKTAQLFKELEV
jgi:putative ABC transport system permease protein